MGRINGLRLGTRRDSQRSKLYKAERVLHIPYGRSNPVPDRSLAEIDDCQRYVDRLTQSTWFVRNYGTFSIEVRHGGGCSSARATGSWLIQLPAWARQKPVILHELAHNVVTRRYPQAAWHGWEFAKTFVELVQHELGVEAAKKLKASFKEHRVRFREPRKLSPEAAARAAARLAQYRNAACEKTADRNLDIALAVANGV